MGQNLAFSMLKSKPDQEKYTTAVCGGCDQYELCVNMRCDTKSQIPALKAET